MVENVFLVIDDSMPYYPVYRLVVGEILATEYYDSKWKVFSVGRLEELFYALSEREEREFTLVDITSDSCQWVPCD